MFARGSHPEGARIINTPAVKQQRRLLLAARSGALGGAERDAGTHGLLLNRGRRTPEFLRDLPRRCSRLGERLEGLKFTGAPGGAVVRWTSCHRRNSKIGRTGVGDHTPPTPHACIPLRSATCWNTAGASHTRTRRLLLRRLNAIQLVTFACDESPAADCRRLVRRVRSNTQLERGNTTLPRGFWPHAGRRTGGDRLTCVGTGQVLRPRPR